VRPNYLIIMKWHSAKVCFFSLRGCDHAFLIASRLAFIIIFSDREGALPWPIKVGIWPKKKTTAERTFMIITHTRASIDYPLSLCGRRGDMAGHCVLRAVTKKYPPLAKTHTHTSNILSHGVSTKSLANQQPDLCCCCNWRATETAITIVAFQLTLAIIQRSPCDYWLMTVFILRKLLHKKQLSYLASTQSSTWLPTNLADCSLKKAATCRTLVSIGCWSAPKICQKDNRKKTSKQIHRDPLSDWNTRTVENGFFLLLCFRLLHSSIIA